jgi:hypothetical protein
MPVTRRQRTRQKISLKDQLENLLSEKRQYMVQHEDTLKKFVKRQKSLYKKLAQEKQEREQTKRNEFREILSNDKLWKKYFQEYCTYNFAEKQNGYLRDFRFSDEDMRLADKYFHLDERELKTLLTVAVENNGIFIGQTKDYRIDFQFDNTNIDTEKKIDKLSIRALSYFTVMVGNQTTIHVGMYRNPPSKDKACISSFKFDLYRIQPYIFDRCKK